MHLAFLCNVYTHKRTGLHTSVHMNSLTYSCSCVYPNTHKLAHGNTCTRTGEYEVWFMHELVSAKALPCGREDILKNAHTYILTQIHVKTVAPTYTYTCTCVYKDALMLARTFRHVCLFPKTDLYTLIDACTFAPTRMEAQTPICSYIHTNAHMPRCTHKYVHISLCAQSHIREYVTMYMLSHTRTHMLLCTHTHTNMCHYVHIRTDVTYACSHTYAHISLCIHTCVHNTTYIRHYVHTHKFAHTFQCTCSHTYAHTSLCTHSQIRTYITMYTLTNTHTCLYVHALTHAYICHYTHTHIRTCTLLSNPPR